MLNFVTSKEDVPQAVLIRAAGDYNGPGKLTKALKIDKNFNKQNIATCPNLWVEDDSKKVKLKTSTRIGIDYAGEFWANKQWRWILVE